MMNSFVYDIPVKVHFGEGRLVHLPQELAQFGRRVLLTYGGGSIKRIGLYDRVVTMLRDADFEIYELSGIEPNPRIESVREGARMCKEHNIDVILAMGGGSTIDAAKFMAAGACVEHDPWEFFGAGAKPIERALPIVTILTLSATGSEMDSGGVISNLATQDKLGRLARPLLPRVSFLDPTLTYTVSPYQTACGAADILSHIIEVYFTTQEDLYMLDCVMEALMKTVVKYAPIAVRDPENYEARANLMWASSWAINGFINGGKRKAWSCHPMEHELSAIYDITHGLGLAILTPRWMEYSLDDERLSKYVSFGVNVFGIDSSLPPIEVAREAIRRLETWLFDDLALSRRLSDVGIGREHFAEMARKACRYGDIDGFRRLTPEDVERIYEMSL